MQQLPPPTLTANPKLDRYFTIAKVILFCMPFLFLGYLRLGAGGDQQGILTASPTAAVSFLSAMIQPYVGWLLILCQRRLADQRTVYAVCNLTALLMAELMMMSTIGVIGLGIILWKTVRVYGVSPVTAWKAAQKKRLFAEVGGSILVCLLAALCLFATLRIGGTL